MQRNESRGYSIRDDQVEFNEWNSINFDPKKVYFKLTNGIIHNEDIIVKISMSTQH